MTQTELKNGQDFNFSNEDMHEGFITWNSRFNNFAIHFNGKCIHTSKTFNSSKQRLEKLMGDWKCEFTLENEFAL
jgi:hypothetical protein